MKTTATSPKGQWVKPFASLSYVYILFQVRQQQQNQQLQQQQQYQQQQALLQQQKQQQVTLRINTSRPQQNGCQF